MKGWGRVNHDKGYHKIINRNLLFCNPMKRYKLKKNKDEDMRYPVFLEYRDSRYGKSLYEMLVRNAVEAPKQHRHLSLLLIALQN